MNEDNAYKVIENLYEYYKDSGDNLASVDAPLSIEYASNEWLIYIFYSCILDYGTRSKVYHNNLINTYKKYPNIFNPRYVIDKYSNRENELLGIMKENIHPRYPNVALKKWMNLSRQLSQYDSLIEKIKLMNLSGLESFVKNIGGFGQKTGGLLIRLIVEAKLISDDQDLNFIPIDRHDIEISYLNGIVEKRELSEHEIRKLSDIFIKIGKEKGIDAGTIDKYLWNVGNTFCNRKDCLSCPLRENCRTKLEEVNNESNND